MRGGETVPPHGTASCSTSTCFNFDESEYAVQFEDEIHLSVISDALWEGKDSGRAAVLIGAGFSRNAESSRINAAKFPLWSEIAETIVKHLYSDPSSFEFRKAKQQAASTSGALRLADEFIAAHGRSSLDDLLIRTIRDVDFRPGDIHRRMMELPWKDVFTTNYDTLLERTAVDVFNRKYGLISNVAEISTARSPRIVKLHGSMPSQRPFILSEEDFRTYPRKFAPFVNLVQQSMMENVFCLFGFSGDDPNFLEWSGWVRDELAEWAPRIYLCGLLDLNDAKRRMLHNRNVTPIDLSLQIPCDDIAPDARQRMAIEYSLSFFEARRPPNPLTWPHPWTKPELQESNVAISLNNAKSDQINGDSIPYLNEESYRKSYPGWIVAPKNIRDSFTAWPLSLRLEELKKTKELDAFMRLTVLDNFNWWLELSLQPLWDPIAIEVHKVLSELNPFPTALNEWPGVAVTGTSPSIVLEEVQNKWLSLAVSYLRYLREERKFEQFDDWSNLLDNVTSISSAHRQRLFYERGLRALDDADDLKLELVLAAWVPNESDAVWKIRKASLLAELGRVDEAQQLASDALVALRRSSTGKRDIANNSREGWCMKRLWTLNQANKSFDEESDAGYRGRWEELNEFQCNPSTEWSLFEALLDRPPPAFPATKKQVGFEPGTFRMTYHYGAQIEPLLPPFQLFRLVEEAGVPTQVGSLLDSPKKCLLNAAKWFQKQDPIRVQSILCRTFDEKLLNKYFTRYCVATLVEREIDEWGVRCLRILNDSIWRMLRIEKYFLDPVADRAHSQLLLSLKILQRIAIRMPIEKLNETFKVVVKLWGSEPTLRSYSFHESLSDLLVSLVRQMPRQDRADAVLELVTLPLVDAKGRSTMDLACNDITVNVPVDTTLISRRAHSERLKIVVHSLTSISKSATIESGILRRVFQRLTWFYINDLLTPLERKIFAKSLWRDTNDDTPLPNVYGLGREVCLQLPEPVLGMAAARLKKFILSTPVPRIRGGIEADDNRLSTIWKGTAEYPGQKTKSGGGFIEWSDAEAVQILDSILNWWNDEGRSLREQHPFFGQDVRHTRLKNIINILIRVVIPHVDPKSPKCVEIFAMVDEIQRMGFQTEVVLPALLRLRSNDTDKCVEQLLRSLFCNDEARINSALSAIFFWIQQLTWQKNGRSFYRLRKLPTRMLDELAILAAHRRQPGLLLVLDSIRWIMIDFPTLITNEFIANVTTALDFLREETAVGSLVAVPHFTFEEIPTFRLYAARVAVLMHSVTRGRSNVTEQWMKEIPSDPFSEVRACLDVDRVDD